MPWETPICRMLFFEEFCRKIEKIPDPLPTLNYDPPMTYFNNTKTYSTVVPYDIFYNFKEGYDPKSNRDDRKALPPLFENIFKEEENKLIPITSQLVYGRPQLLESPVDTSGRKPKINATKDFYRFQEINISPDLEEQPEH